MAEFIDINHSVKDESIIENPLNHQEIKTVKKVFSSAHPVVGSRKRKQFIPRKLVFHSNDNNVQLLNNKSANQEEVSPVNRSSQEKVQKPNGEIEVINSNDDKPMTQRRKVGRPRKDMAQKKPDQSCPVSSLLSNQVGKTSDIYMPDKHINNRYNLRQKPKQTRW